MKQPQAEAWFHLGGLLAACLFLVSVPVRADDHSAVVGSKHDLSFSGSGPVTSGESEACVFCHGSHLPENAPAKAPLWNKDLPGANYNVYSSSTYDAAPGDLSTSTSKLCLSCHDGTIAVGMTLTKGSVTTRGNMPGRRLGQATLDREHPVGFQPVDDGQLVASLFQDPPTTSDSAVALRNGRIECITCHSPHEPARDPVAEKFLVRSNSNGTLCLACHDPSRTQPNLLNGWNASAHATVVHSTPPSQNYGPYGTVAANACANCHEVHQVTGPATTRLLRDLEESNCLRCHENSPLSPTILDVGQELSNRTYSHPVKTVGGVHDPATDGFPVNNTRHSECSDCHNPHTTGSPGASVPPAVSSALQGALGYDGTSVLFPAVNEYEVCFKCHADSLNKPQTATGAGSFGWTVRRQADALVLDPFNTRLEFESGVSRHNVSNPRGGSGSNPGVLSLRPAVRLPDGSTGRSLAKGTYLYCADCHNNNFARNFGGAAPNGPHGSDNEHLLVLPYPVNIAPFAPGGGLNAINDTSYPLCNMCHSIARGEGANAILNDSTFAEHDVHVRGAGLSCSNCHDGHGIQGGTYSSNRALINFDLDRVAPLPGRSFPEFNSAGVGSGSCDLVCHNVTHNGFNY